MRRKMTAFTLTLWAALVLVWLGSGTRFIDWAYAMPDLGRLDDITLSLLDRVDGLRADMGVGDGFAALRRTLHGLTGLTDR